MSTNTKGREAQEHSDPVEEKQAQRTARWPWPAMQRRSWKELSPAQRSANIILGGVEFLLTGWALWDLRHRPEDLINGKKRIWVMTSLIQPFGPMVYLLFGRKRGDAPLAV